MEVRDDHDSMAAQESTDHKSIEKLELELERREVIGELLKLNPSYKAPADYKPLLKEDKVAIPIKDYPGRNFIGLIFGPAGDTQKRLEKETGAKIRIYGTKADTNKENEITLSDGSETHGDYEELYVSVTAETYEKVDAAVSLIELLFTPVFANTAAVSGDNTSSVSLAQDTRVIVNQGVTQFTGSGQTTPLPHFQPYPNQRVPTNQSSGFIAPPYPNLSIPVQVKSNPSNSAAMPSLYGPRTVMSGPLGVVPHNQQHSHMPQVTNIGYAGPPRNPSLPPSQISPGRPTYLSQPVTPIGSNHNMRPIRSPIPRPGWSQPPATSPGTHGPNMPQIMPSSVRHQAPQFHSSVSPSPITPLPQIGTQGPNPVRPPPMTAPRAQQPSSNDFTFQTNRPQTPTLHPVPRLGTQRGSHFMPPQNPSGHLPQSPSFQTPPIVQSFHRAHNSHQMGPPQDRQPVLSGHGPRPLANQMGPRQFGPGPGSGSRAGPFSTRPGNFGLAQQSHPSIMGLRPQNFVGHSNQQSRGSGPYSLGMPSFNPSRPQQVYDPFSPTAVPHKPGNPQNSRKQETDPEYDDLMASVGVK
ncbi:uncharacterized protein [Rutidosis leptorrhynchoides]